MSKDKNIRYGNRGAMLEKHREFFSKSAKSIRHNFKRIVKWTKYKFSDMADWKWLDNIHNSSGKKRRCKLRKSLSRVAKRKENEENRIEIQNGINEWNDEHLEK